MGADCSCYDGTKSSEQEVSLQKTIKIEDLCEINNRELEKMGFASMKDCRLSLQKITIKRSTETPLRMSKIQEGKRVLSESEYSNIDLSEILLHKHLPDLNLSVCLDGVFCLPKEIFELENGSIYKGEFDREGLQHGRGVEIKPNGSKYLGYYVHGKIHGQGRLKNAEGIVYQGNFRTFEGTTKCEESAVLHGQGVEIWPNGIQYKGEFNMGMKHGQGKLMFPESTYKGEFFNDEIHGQGEMIWNNGKKYKGQWEKGLMHGQGEFSWPNKKSYKGSYKNNVKSGKGIMTWPGGKRYEGEWEDGKQHGKGIYTFYDMNNKKLRSGRSEWSNGNRIRWLSIEDN